MLYGSNCEGLYWITTLKNTGTFPTETDVYYYLEYTCSEIDNSGIQVVMTLDGKQFYRPRVNDKWNKWFPLSGSSLIKSGTDFNKSLVSANNFLLFTAKYATPVSSAISIYIPIQALDDNYRYWSAADKYYNNPTIHFQVVISKTKIDRAEVYTENSKISDAIIEMYYC